MNRKFPIVFFLFLLTTLRATAQELPPVINYLADSYGAGNQNWMISQTPNRFIYVANNEGLLEYDGSRWTLYPTPNESIMRSVHAQGDSIYTGFYMGFGYWKKNTKGSLEYTSLSDQLPFPMIEDEQIWNIVPYKKWLLFQSLDRIILMNTDTLEFEVVEADGILTKMLRLDDEIYFQEFGKGLFTFDNGEKVLICDDEEARIHRIVGIASGDDIPYFITEDDGVFALRNGHFSPWDHPSNDVLKKYTIYNASQKKNGGIVLGTISNGSIHLDPSGTIDFQLGVSTGLENNTVLSLFEDIDQNIWLGLDNGIDCVNTNSPVRSYVQQDGSLGTTYTSIVHNGNLYLGTNQGLFTKPIDSEEPFQLIDNTEGQVWFLKEIEEALVCGHNVGTFVVEGTTVTKISAVQGAWDIKPVPGKEGLFIQGNYDGLYLMENKNGEWRIRNKIYGFDISSRDFEWIGDSEILVSHEYKGLYHLTLAPELHQVLEVKTLKFPEKGIHCGLTRFDEALYFANSEGIYKSSLDTVEFAKDAQLSALIEEEEYATGNLITDQFDRLWLITKSNLIGISKDDIDDSYSFEKVAFPHYLRNEMEGFENLTFLSKNRGIYGNSGGYLLIDLDKFEERELRINITSLTSIDKQGETMSLELQDSQEIPYTANNLNFEFSIPDYEKYELVQYQYKIQGFSEVWSDWTTESKYEIKNIPAGEYVFEVRAKINEEILNDTARLSFTILRPWYLSNLALVSYAVIFILTFIFINGLYRRYYRKQRERILEETTKDLKLRELAAQKEIYELKSEKLSQDIESRNRELAISTMNMVGKKTTLGTIKSQLEELNDDKRLSGVISNIDAIINDKKDWEFFEQAFNHADKEFFKKLKDLHPNLTHNDLKLCVYLRLNLSSKEIAPLLNISHRSVEIKRYRLRKKLDLEHDINLNDYFINL